MPDKTRDTWDKVDIILKPVGGFLTALAVAYVGILGSQYLKNREAIEADTQLYAELLSKKQEQDISFRRDILKPIIDKVEAPGKEPLETRMLNLELLAANFQESLDLGPILKNMYGQLDPKESSTPRYANRLERDATEIKRKQLAALGGQIIQMPVDLSKLSTNPAGIRVLEHDFRLHSENTLDQEKRHFIVDLFRADQRNKELLLRMRVLTPKFSDQHTLNYSPEDIELDTLFWVSLFDFPMTQNVSLSHGQRCAVVMNEFSNESDFAQITLAYFPESSEDPVQVLRTKVAISNR